MIVIRSLEVFLLFIIKNLTECKVFSQHKYKTTAVSFSPNSVFVISGDEMGSVKIWWVDDFKIKKEFDGCLGGKINGFGWNEENDRLLVYGDGKTA